MSIDTSPVLDTDFGDNGVLRVFARIGAGEEYRKSRIAEAPLSEPHRRATQKLRARACVAVEEDLIVTFLGTLSDGYFDRCSARDDDEEEDDD